MAMPLEMDSFYSFIMYIHVCINLVHVLKTWWFIQQQYGLIAINLIKYNNHVKFEYNHGIMIRQFYRINLKFEYNLNISVIIIISADSLIVTMIPNML